MSAARRTITDLLLTVAAVIGVLCAVLAVAGTVAGFGVVLFRTGSMAPTIPAGSAALVRTVAAAELRVGDVVTVDRPGQLPVTHRVVQVTAVPDEPQSRDLVLRGDANPVADPLPYRVDEARRVLTSVPGVASLIAGWGQPLVLGGVALAVAAGVTVAFWPRRAAGGSASASGVGTAATTQSCDVLTRAGDSRVGVSRRGRRVAGPVLAVMLAAGLATVAAPPGTAHAVSPTLAPARDPLLAPASTRSVMVAPPVVVAPPAAVASPAAHHLTVDAELVGDNGPLAPGDSRDWFLTVRTVGVTGTVTRRLEVVGVDDPALAVRVDRCADRACTEPVALVDPVVPAPDRVVTLPDQPAPGTELLRVQVSLSPDAGSSSQGIHAALRFTAAGAGEAVAVVVPGGDGSPVAPTPPTEATEAVPDRMSPREQLTAASAGVPALAVTGGAWRLIAVVSAALVSTGLVAAAVTRIAAREEER